jgi:dUTP pyrophosphatase
MDLEFVLLRAAAHAPSRTHPDDAGVDLRASNDVRLEAAGGRAAIATGVAVAIPTHHVGLICPRSGLAAKHGVTVLNAPGVVDAGFRGELIVVLVNTDPENHYDLRVGDRVAQLLVLSSPEVWLKQVSSLNPSARQDAGLGSSGR